jgi:CHAT domain-containing protein
VHLRPEGVATALEVAGMNLWGTQLVVLSACETGMGDVSNLGQGVYGLRRAVMIAGAETLVTSLWKVDDHATRELMQRYYEHLLDGQGRAEAMRETSDWMRKQYTHPHYWASFVVVGSPDPLVGIRAGKQRQPKVATSIASSASPDPGLTHGAAAGKR